ncbi:hypothetical protein V7S43_014492 [Phytophthora oleae]|uniref:Uncharacterized protein n=1 Tax=Phytophthora oleae TaxID=2107226 RepID=A0ABD3F0U8_9STRA
MLASHADDRHAEALCGDLHTLVEAVSQAETVKPKKKRKYKKRKSTHTVRKEESQALEVEIRGLEATLEALKLRALVESGGEDKSLQKEMMHNSVLREAVQNQHLVAARAQAMLVGCAQRHSYDIRPTETYIHLTTDHAQRLKALEELRGPKLQYGKQFILQRSAGLHPTAAYLNEERYETPEGDFCNVRLERTALLGVRGGVKAVFDALKHAIFNAEIVLSEASGNITVREDDNMDDMDKFSQMRLVTQSNFGVLVENNLVHFSDLVQAEEGDAYAIATVDFVDKDDQFPYRPRECIRRDASSVILLTSHSNVKVARIGDVDNYGGHTSSEEDNCEAVVVMTRWTFSRICRSNLHVPTQTLREMRDRAGQVSDTIQSCVRETLGLP